MKNFILNYFFFIFIFYIFFLFIILIFIFFNLFYRTIQKLELESLLSSLELIKNVWGLYPKSIEITLNLLRINHEFT
jgi:hypothetical protein